jgi:glutathione peroxidase
MLKSIYDYSHKNILTGKPVSFDDYKGKVLLIVNTASKCGFTYQYEALERLYLKYQKQGLEILAFPSNDYMNQDPGTNGEIADYCTLHFGVTFPLFEKSHVRGKQINDLFAYLTSQEKMKGPVMWNFEKFLISRTGELTKRLKSNIKPENIACVNEIERLLALL